MATETASFGAGKRESHDASAFYRRRLLEHVPAVTTGEPNPNRNVSQRCPPAATSAPVMSMIRLHAGYAKAIGVECTSA